MIGTEPKRPAPIPPKIKPPRRHTHNRQLLTEEILLDAMGIWLHRRVPINGLPQ
jgi:hypothetical protein